MPRLSAREAALELAKGDKVVKRLVAEHGLPAFGRPTKAAERFGALVRAITYQQLAGKAAASIHGRLVESLSGEVTAVAVTKAGEQKLRSCGLSAAKAGAILDLADKVLDGTVPVESLGRLPDDEVAAHLVLVKGIGQWTADMFLMFTLGRLDIWPTGDYGVRVGFASAWGLPSTPSAKELQPFGDSFRPYRSVVAWYCWRAVDGQTP